MFLIKIVQKVTGNQKAVNKQSKKNREIRERKDKTKGKQSKNKKVSKKFANVTQEGKDLCSPSKVEKRI